MHSLSHIWGTVAQAATILTVSQKTIRRRIADGTIEAKRFGPRLVRVDMNSVESLGRNMQSGGDAS